jgi:hypothetical protein
MKTSIALLAGTVTIAAFALAHAPDSRADDSPLDGPIGELIDLLDGEFVDPDDTTLLLDLLLRESAPCVREKVQLGPPSQASTPEQALGPMAAAAGCMEDLGSEILDGHITTHLDPTTMSRQRKRALKKGVKNLGRLADDMADAGATRDADRARFLRRAINRSRRPIPQLAQSEGFAHIEEGLYSAVARAVELETADQLAAATDLKQRLDAAVPEPPKGRAFKQASKRLDKALRLLGECAAGIAVLLPIPKEIETIEDKGPRATPAEAKRQRDISKQFKKDWPKLMDKLFLGVKSLGQAAGPLEQAIRDAEPPEPGLPSNFFATVAPGTYFVSFYPGNTLNPPGQGLNALDEFTNWHFTHAGALEVTTREQLWVDVQALVRGTEQDLGGTFEELFFNVITNQGEPDWEAQIDAFADVVNGSVETTWRFFEGGLLGSGYTVYADYRTSSGDTTSIVLYLHRGQPPLPQAFLDVPAGEYLVSPMLRDFRMSRDVILTGNTVRKDDPEEFWADVDAELGAQFGSLESVFGAALDSTQPIEREVLDEVIAVTNGCGPDHLPMDFSVGQGGELVFTRTITCSVLDPQGLGSTSATFYVRVSRIGD